MSNRLAACTSPYLRQHAHNPVDWYPWGEEALARARAEDRPILLSVGYSSCHWCHVMERESFEDPSTAALMNALFVNVKVDREERPDIDHVYMQAVQAMTGRGGWPMTVFLTPDLAPYFGGTYFPPEPRPGMPSFSEVLRAASDAYVERREQVVQGGARLVEALARAQEGGAGDGPVGAEALDAAWAALRRRYDAAWGGFGRAPKFPQPTTLELVLRQWGRTGDPSALEAVLHTLRRMAAGGIRDHVGGGFHRYSVDERWLVPHFEKMLYDNALLARVYLDAFRATGEGDLRAVAVETLEYLAYDLRDPEGGFHAARDADSEGTEGAFYVWTPEEVAAVLGSEEARLFGRLYDVGPGGNFEGRSIPHLPHGFAAVAASERLAEDDLRLRAASWRAALRDARSRRPEPFRDEKVIVAWNGMAVRAFAEAGATLGRWDLVDVASTCADFLLAELVRDGRLLHSWIGGTASPSHAFLDDHAALGNGLLSLHAATLEGRWLGRARWLCDEILERFRDAASGAFYDTAADAEPLVVRPRAPMDSATPSGPALAAELLARAGHLLDEPVYRESAAAILAHDAESLRRHGPAFARLLCQVDRTLAPTVEIAIAGGRDDATRALVTAAHRPLLGAATVTGRVVGDEEILDIPLLEDRGQVEGRPAAYVCVAYACHRPVTDPVALTEEIASLAGRGAQSQGSPEDA